MSKHLIKTLSAQCQIAFQDGYTNLHTMNNEKDCIFD